MLLYGLCKRIYMHGWVGSQEEPGEAGAADATSVAMVGGLSLPLTICTLFVLYTLP